MLLEKKRIQKEEKAWLIAGGLLGMMGTYFWTDSIGAMVAFGGLASIIVEGISAITRRLDNLPANTKVQ